MKSIVTLTLNPSIDGSAQAETVRPILKVRTVDERYDPGGGGINVARVVRELGGSTLALYLAGGATGAVLDDLLAAAAIPQRRFPITNHTRISHAVFEWSSGLEYRFVPEGPVVAEAEWRACLAALDKIDCDYLVASGSLGADWGVVEIRGWRSPVRRRLRDHAARSMEVAARGSARVSQPSTLRMTI